MGCKCKEITNADVISKIDDIRKPFTEFKVSSDEVIRVFDSKYPDHLFKWHFDEEDRTVEILHETDWKFQFDNEIPMSLTPGLIIKIDKDIYHRIVKGTNLLITKIKFF